MNPGVMICALMSALFLFCALLFALLKERGAMLISGFNTLKKAEQEQYDQKAMGTDMRNTLLVWALVFAAGSVASYFLSPYFAAAAFVIWLVLLQKDVRLDPYKAFEKYRK